MEYFDPEKRDFVFYRNKDNPDYYIVYCSKLHTPETMLQKINHTGEFENSGYPYANIELAYRFTTDKLNIDQSKEFLKFIAKHISSDYIEHDTYTGDFFKAWCKLENYEPEKWLTAFEEYNEKKDMERRKIFRQETQLSLF